MTPATDSRTSEAQPVAIPLVSITRIASSSAQPPKILARGQKHVLRALVANKNSRRPAPPKKNKKSYSIALRIPPCLLGNLLGNRGKDGRRPPAPPKILVV